jgi:hypothetical protein
MKFFKENSYDIVKLFINQMGITIFALVLYTAIGFIDNVSLNLQVKIILSVFATVFYFALLYTATWDFGAKDKIRIDGGKYSATKYKGLLMSLISGIPTFLLAGACIITMIVHISSGNEALLSAFAVLNMFLRFISSMFLGILQGIFSFLSYNVNLRYLWESVGYFVMPLISAIICHIGYTFGRREFKILSLFSGKSKK